MRVTVLDFMLPRGELGAEGPDQSNHCETTGKRVTAERNKSTPKTAGVKTNYC